MTSLYPYPYPQPRFPVRKFIIRRSTRECISHFLDEEAENHRRRWSSRIKPGSSPRCRCKQLERATGGREKTRGQLTMHTRRYTSRVARWLLCAGVSRRISCHFHRLIEHTIETRLLSLSAASTVEIRRVVSGGEREKGWVGYLDDSFSLHEILLASRARLMRFPGEITIINGSKEWTQRVKVVGDFPISKNV